MNPNQVEHARALREDNKLKPTHAPGQNPFAQPTQSPNPFAQPQQGQQPPNPFAQPQQGQQPPNPFAQPQQGQQPPNPFASPTQANPSAFGNGFNNTQPPQQSPQGQFNPPQKGVEDRLGDGIEAGVVGIWGFFKEVSASFKEVDAEHLRLGADRTFKVSLGLAASTLALGFFKPDIWWVSGGALLTIPVSMIWSKLLSNKVSNTQKGYEQYTEPMQPTMQPEPQPVTSNPFSAQSNEDEYDLSEEEDEDEYDLSEEEEDEYDLSEEEDEEEYDLTEDEDEDEEPLWKRNLASYKPSNQPDTLGALADIDKIDPTMVSRQFLLEAFLKATQSITPTYHQRIEIDEDTMQFDETDAIIKDIFSVIGFKDEEDLPDLQTYTESLFVDELIVSRPQKSFKTELVDAEYTQILRKGYNGQGGNIRMFAKSELIGRTLVIRIFKGATPMVSMNDVIAANKGYYLDTDNDMPLILSIDEEGKETKMNFLEEDGLIISGKKRSGKSYTMRSILSQMMIFNGPSKLNFYIGDAKGAASDFYKMRTPHVKRFESDPFKILKMLEYIVNVEAKRREKLFAEAGVIKIDDYHTARPDAKDMPYLYVLVDEMVTLSTKLKELSSKESDLKGLYFGYLTSLVTMLPAYGIRLMAVPHRITNDFLPKTASDNTTFKIAVRADEGLLKETFSGLTSRQFGYDTPNKGDLAIKCTLVRPEPFYGRSIVPSDTIEVSDRIFDFQAKLWAKIEPESVASSVMQLETPQQQTQDTKQEVQQKSPYMFQESKQTVTNTFQGPGLSLQDIENNQKQRVNLFEDDDDDFI